MKIENFYTAFGYVTCAFAEMEADLRSLIAGLAFGENAVTASVFLDSSQLGENCRTLQKLGRQHWDYGQTIKQIVNKIDAVRPVRNLFIHGLWSAGDFCSSGGKAQVRDLNAKYEEDHSSRKWIHGAEVAYSITDFNGLLADVREVTGLIARLREQIEKDEDVQISPFGATTIGKPERMVILPDGTLVSVGAPTRVRRAKQHPRPQ
jgi:hypothetical protein